jgi:hypothetical protein
MNEQRERELEELKRLLEQQPDKIDAIKAILGLT